MRAQGRSWVKPQDWIWAFGVGWPALLAALYLKFSDKFRRAYGEGRRQRRLIAKRKAYANQAIMELWQKLKQGATSHEQMRHCRENILDCVTIHVAQLLGYESSDQITASLLDLHPTEPDSMIVTARAPQGRQVPKLYQKESLLAWDAIHTGDVAVEHDIQDNPRWNHAGQRKYRAVLAIPIVYNNKAYGCLSLDAETPYAFMAKASDIQVMLMPYVALLALTYPEDAPTETCNYDASHLKL